ncbi:MAG TPA: DUF2750 domain-containing protein [Thermoanaerobaculia bacterium]|nr:DUF2750 domain-containing protein [Thermoanaerobaculia bacterium]
MSGGAGWELGEDEARDALALPAQGRYTLFLQLACDWEEAWGLRNPDGWVVASGPEGDSFPLWPHPHLAQACARGPWEDAAPAAIPLDELLDDLLPLLAEDHVKVAAFPTPDGESWVVAPDELRRGLEAELALGQSGEESP